MPLEVVAVAAVMRVPVPTTLLPLDCAACWVVGEPLYSKMPSVMTPLPFWSNETNVFGVVEAVPFELTSACVMVREEEPW